MDAGGDEEVSKDVLDDDDDDEENDYKNGQAEENELMAETKFVALVNMLSVLHERLQTKQPSRFLASSINVMLPSYKACRFVCPRLNYLVLCKGEIRVVSKSPGRISTGE